MNLSLWIGQADVFVGNDHQATGQTRQVFRLNQTGGVVEAGIDIATPNGFLQSREDVVVGIAVLVHADVGLLQAIFHGVQIDVAATVITFLGRKHS